MICMDVDAALSEVPVNVAPLTDDGDFKTIEDSVAYNASGMALYWHFVTTGGAETTTQVTPTTGGSYDWAHAGQGMYTIEIPASGGASINNDAEGFGYFTGFATGVLPWRGPTICFRAAALNNLLIDDAFSTTRGLAGTALPNAAADAAGGLPISDAGGLDLDAKIGALTFTVAGDVDVNVQTWGGTAISTPPAVNATQISGDSTAADTLELFAEALDQATGQLDSGSFASGAFDAVWSVSARTLTAATNLTSDIATAVWGAATRLLTAGTNIVLAKGTGVTGFNDLSAAQVNAEVDTALADYDPPTRTEATADKDEILAAQGTAQADLDILTGTDGVTLATSQPNYAPAKAGDQMALVDDAIAAGKFDQSTAFPMTTSDGSDLTEVGGDGAQLTEAGGTGDHLTAVGGLGSTARSHVNAEVVDALATDTYAEPASVPAATSSLKDKINWVFKLMRNKREQSEDTETVYADDGTTAVATSTKSDDGTKLTRGEWTNS